MKHIMIFDPIEDKDDLTFALKGKDYWGCLWDLDCFLRRKVNKGEHDFKTADEALEATYNALYDILDNHNCSLDEVC